MNTFTAALVATSFLFTGALPLSASEPPIASAVVLSAAAMAPAAAGNRVSWRKRVEEAVRVSAQLEERRSSPAQHRTSP